MRELAQPRLDRPLRAIKLGAPKRNHRYAGSRICESENCQTVLSIYNDSRRCWLHQPFRYPGAPKGRRSANQRPSTDVPAPGDRSEGGAHGSGVVTADAL